MALEFSEIVEEAIENLLIEKDDTIKLSNGILSDKMVCVYDDVFDVIRDLYNTDALCKGTDKNAYNRRITSPIPSFFGSTIGCKSFFGGLKQLDYLLTKESKENITNVLQMIDYENKLYF